MRSKMLGLAIALSTFGVGVAATTLWLSRHPQPRKLVMRVPRYVLVAEPSAAAVGADEVTPCEAARSAARSGKVAFLGKPVDGGSLDDHAVSRPQPSYPDGARSALVSGAVRVEVLVDVCGSVVVARAVSGHPLLRQAAIDAAMKTRFSPTRVTGIPVPVKGTLAYDFSLQ